MEDSIKNELQKKYSKSKFLYFIHLGARYIKDLYHPTGKKPFVIGVKNQVPSRLPEGMKVFIYGNNNRILIDPSIKIYKAYIELGDNQTPIHNCTISIGEGSSSNGIVITLFEDNSSVKIGKNCMFSWGINIFASDTHAIYHKDTKELLNWGREIVIEDHVWLGMNTTILKNTHIAKNCIVGAGAVVSGQFNEENCIIAGNPARIVKKNINWDGARPKEWRK